jgi:Na+-translocating ferredoxin:NAD+ oxidoreductase RnfA subunit
MDILNIFVIAFFTHNLFLIYYVGVEYLGRWSGNFAQLLRQQLAVGFLFLLGVTILWPLGEFVLFPSELPFLWSLAIPVYALAASWVMDLILGNKGKDSDQETKREMMSRGLLMGGLFLVLKNPNNLSSSLLLGFFSLLGFLLPLIILFFVQKELQRRNTPLHYQGIPRLLSLPESSV